MVPVIFGLTGFILAPALLDLLKTPALIMRDAVLYTRFMCIGLLFVSLYNYLSSMLKALGDSRTPLYFLIISTVINIILDILLICVFSLGIMGAALATVVSQFISVVLCAIHACRTNPYFKMRREDMSLSPKMIYQVIRLGVPMSIQFALIALSCPRHDICYPRRADRDRRCILLTFQRYSRSDRTFHGSCLHLHVSGIR